MKLAIYETVHLDWVLPYCEMFLLRSDEVYFLTNISFEKDIRATLGSSFSKFHWEFMDTEMSQTDFYKTLQRFFTLGEYDGIILNSVEARHLFVAMAVRQISSPIFINVHDVNNFFRPTWQFALRPLSRTVGKKLLLKKASGYITNAEAMRDFMVSEQISTRPVFWLPPVIANADLMQLQPSDVITFTIPGSIDEKR
ncbi:MAG: hypothetical protein V4676_04590, partial [Bacteroidota bacterium]